MYRGVIWVLGYEAIKAKTPGDQTATPVPIGEIYIPDVEVFPLRNAADLALKEFQSMTLDSITSLDIPFSSVTIADPPRKRAEYITLERILKFGATPSCKGCQFESATHSPVCRARFESLIKADRISKAARTPVPPAPPLERPPAEVSEEVPAEASPGDGQHPGDERATEGLVAKVEGVKEFVDRYRERVRQRKLQTLNGTDILFEYACGESSELTEAAAAIGVNSIRLSRATLDLSEPTHVAQVQGQVQACPGCDIWLSLPCADYCPWQDMNIHVHGPSFENNLQKRRKNSSDVAASFGGSRN